MSTEWSMPRRGEACTGCQRPFGVGERFAVHLYEAAGGYERREFCERCPPPPQPAPVAAWKTRRPAPATRRTASFDRETVFGIFERLSSADQPAQVQLRFVLALLLWRKKLLRLEGTSATDGQEAWEFVVAQTGAAQRVLRPDLDEQQLEQLSTQLEGLLAGEAQTREEQTDG